MSRLNFFISLRSCVGWAKERSDVPTTQQNGGHASLCPPYIYSKYFKYSKKTTGFTLIEVMIALFIFAIISMIMVNGLHSVLTTQSRVQKHAERLAETQLALTILSRDFEQAINRPVTNASGAIEHSFLGSYDNATFTHAGLVNPQGLLPRSTLQRTRYRLANEILIRETWGALDQTAHTPLNQRKLLTAVSNLHLEYLDDNGRFQDRWPPADQKKEQDDLPRAVRIHITLKDSGNITQLYVIPRQKSDKPTDKPAEKPAEQTPKKPR